MIDTLIRGIAGGGLRMRSGCSLAEVRDLAHAMTLKEAIAFGPGQRYLPLGGAKGGIDFDPLDPRAGGVLARYLEAMVPLIKAHWAFGEDLGVRQDELDALAAGLGLRATVDAALREVDDGPEAGLARLRAAFQAEDRAIGLGELVGGYGVARATVAALEAIGRDPCGATAVVQGFGSMGGAAARYLADAGVRVVAVADAHGLVANEAGLEVERWLRSRGRHGELDRTMLRAGDRDLPRERWASIPCDALIPAAVSYAIDEALAHQLRSAVVVEAANVATLPAAELVLAGRGIPVVPDFVANLATNAWWWWTLFGDIEPTPASAFARIEATIPALVSEAFARSAPGSTLRSAAVEMAGERARAARIATEPIRKAAVVALP